MFKKDYIIGSFFTRTTHSTLTHLSMPVKRYFNRCQSWRVVMVLWSRLWPSLDQSSLTKAYLTKAHLIIICTLYFCSPRIPELVVFYSYTIFNYWTENQHQHFKTPNERRRGASMTSNTNVYVHRTSWVLHFPAIITFTTVPQTSERNVCMC